MWSVTRVAASFFHQIISINLNKLTRPFQNGRSNSLVIIIIIILFFSYKIIIYRTGLIQNFLMRDKNRFLLRLGYANEFLEFVGCRTRSELFKRVPRNRDAAIHRILSATFRQIVPQCIGCWTPSRKICKSPPHFKRIKINNRNFQVLQADLIATLPILANAISNELATLSTSLHNMKINE